MHEPVFTQILQVAVVVRDLDAAVRRHADEYGVGPWRIYEFNPGTVHDMVRDEEPAEYAMRVALAMIGDVQLELIQPLDDRSIYADFLRERGEGLHHLGLGANDYRETLGLLRGKGHRVVQGGVYNGVTFAYLSTERDLGFVAELFDWPDGHEQAPDAVYPPEAAVETA